MRSLLFAALVSCLAITVVVGAERTWSGGGGLGTSAWSSTLNWEGPAPVANDALTFPSKAPANARTAVNDSAFGTAFGPLTLDAGGYVISGALIDLKGGIFLNGANTVQISLPLEIDALSAFTVTNQNGVMNLTQPISGAGGIIKSGSGLLVVNGNHNYTGPTIIAGGGLQVGGNLPGKVEISSGDLIGIGSVDGITSLNQGVVRVAPGTRSATGTLTSDGDVRFNTSDALLFDITSTGADKLVVNGTVTLGRAGLDVSIQPGYTPAVDTTWTLIDNDGTDRITAAGATPSDFLIPTFVRNNQRFQISFVGGTNRNDVVLRKVGPQNTTISRVTTSDASIAYGQSVDFSVTVTGTVSGGTVSFWDGNEYIGAAIITGAQARLDGVTTLKPSFSPRAITAMYEGNTTYAPVRSEILEQNVSGTVTSVTLTLAPGLGTSAPDELVTFTATVTDSSPGSSPTGSVTFYDGTMILGDQIPVTSNQAVFTTSALKAGTHSQLYAVFSGTGAFLSDVSNIVSHTVNGTATSIGVISSLNPTLIGDALTLTATVVGGTTGVVIFRDGAIILAEVPIGADGVATFTTSGLSVGTHSITAEYLGTTAFAPSISPALSQTISARPDGSGSSGGGGGGPVELKETSGCGLGSGVATLLLGLVLFITLRLRRS